MSDDFDPDAYLADRQQPDDNSAPPSAPPSDQGQQFDPDKYLSNFDPDAYLKGAGDQPPSEGAVKTFGRAAAHGVVPGAGAIAGAEAGAELGSFGGPVGAFAGAVVGGIAGAYLGSKAQQVGMDELGYDDSQQMAANAREHPVAEFAGEMAPAVATMRPDRAATLLQRGVSGAVMGGLEGVQEYENEGDIDPAKVLAAAGVGAALPSANRLGEAIGSPARRFAAKVAGRPNVEPNPGASAAQDEAQTSQQPPVEGEASTVQVAPSIDGDTVGNPQSQPTRSDRVYPKGTTAPASAGPDMLTQGDYAPDVMAALEGFRNFKPEAAANPNDIDQSLKAAPIQTGFPQAATTEPVAPVSPRPTSAPAANPSQGSRVPEPTSAPRPQEVAAPQQPEVRAPEAAPRAPDQAAPAPEVHPEAQKVAEVRDDVAQPTPAQAEAGNFAKGHPGRLFGREVSIETPKGGVREDTKNTPPLWRVENFPYDYGEFLGTKGADGDRVDVGVVGTGDRHFVIDQKDPATGQFDEHKVMAYAKDPVDALDHYYRGFTDGSGESRVGSIKEATADELTKWLAKPGKKKTPFDPSAFNDEGVQALGPTEGEKPLPKVVTAAVTKLRAKAAERGDGTVEVNGVAVPVDHAVNGLMNMEPSARLGEASRYVNETASVPARPDRIRTAAPIVEGIKNDASEPVTARDKTDAARKSADVKTMNDAYERFGKDIELPTTPEDKAALRARVQKFVDDTAGVKYKPNLKHSPYLLQRAAKKLLTAKNPSDKSWQDFAGTVKQLGSGDEAGVRAAHRTEADIGLSKRSGDEAIANAEAARAQGSNTTEDDMLAAIDRARESEFKGDIPHEEAEAMVPPERAATPADLQRIEGAKEHIDITEPGGRKQLAKQLAALPRTKEKGGAVGTGKGPVALAEGSTPEAPKASEVRKINVATLPKDYLEKLLERANKPKQSTRLDAAEHIEELKKTKNPTLRDLGEALWRDEAGKLDDIKVMKDLTAAAQHIVAKTKGRFGRLVDFKHEPYSSYRAREPRSETERYANDLSDRLVAMENGDHVQKLGLEEWQQALPKDLNNPKTMERMYFTREAGKTNLLNAQDQALYAKHLEPTFDLNDQLYDAIEALRPGMLGPKVDNHIYRIAKGDSDIFNPEGDPITGERAISTNAKGTMLSRKFFALEDQGNGRRFVVSPSDDGYTVWHNRKPIKVVDPNFAFVPGESYKVGSRTYTMKEAMTPEIEQHALFGPGQKAEYYHNAGLSAAAANYYLGSVLRHLQFLEDLKKDPEFRQFATPPGGKAPGHFIETTLSNFKGWRLHPQLAHVLDDYAQPGINADALNTLRDLSQGVVKTIFWNPVPHISNVGVHWYGARGFRWLPFSGGYKSLAETGLDAIKSVVNQDDFQKDLLANGASLMYPRVITKDFMGNLARGFGEAVKKDPSKWDPIARQFGIGPSDLVRAVYNASSKTMWAANDMFYTQHVKELMNEGLDMKQAIIQAERHIPNYRIPAAVMGTGVGARIAAQVFSEPALTLFGRYHAGIYNSYANIAKDLVHGNGGAKLDAVGNLFAMGLMAFAIYPMLDRAVHWLTGNNQASMQRRGSLSLPSHVVAATRGKEDPLSALRTTFPLSPLLTIPMEQLTNRDFRGKPILERQDFSRAAHGDAVGAANLAAQEGDYLGRNLFSPFNTAANTASRPDLSMAGGLRDQILDIKNPSPKAIKYGANSAKYNQRSARQRMRSGAGPLETLVNKATR